MPLVKGNIKSKTQTGKAVAQVKTANDGILMLHEPIHLPCAAAAAEADE
jgi:hypothetical protein